MRPSPAARPGFCSAAQEAPLAIRRTLPVLDQPAGAQPSAEALAALPKLFAHMLRLRALDEKMLLLQRQGRIAFYGPNTGQEAAIIGSGLAIEPGDWVFPALREGYLLLMRGMPLTRWLAQLYGSAEDIARGRQQPMHWCSRRERFVSWSSVIGTQLPHAVGFARGLSQGADDAVAIAFLGDGATSATDFHTAMNFAGLWRPPLMFICQNNQWAISLPVERQTRSPSLAAKAHAYGLPSERVDGNDVLAVFDAVREARARAAKGQGPTFLELVTYRRLGHSSSDDPSRYRDEGQTSPWLLEDPLERARRALAATGFDVAGFEARQRMDFQADLERAIAHAEAVPAPQPLTLFDDLTAHPDPRQDTARALAAAPDAGMSEGAFPL